MEENNSSKNEGNEVLQPVTARDMIVTLLKISIPFIAMSLVFNFVISFFSDLQGSIILSIILYVGFIYYEIKHINENNKMINDLIKLSRSLLESEQNYSELLDKHAHLVVDHAKLKLIVSNESTPESKAALDSIVQEVLLEIDLEKELIKYLDKSESDSDDESEE